MAACKALKLMVELDINTVTCPGVWLPNKGEVLVRLWMLDGTSRTTSILPVFPLVYNENFLFEKVFPCQRLPDLHRKLANETMRAELQQLRDGHITPLANFECSLLTLLFPEVDRQGLQCSEEISLCMQPLFLFPGVLPPKLEISTRTLIEEAVRGTTKKSCIRKTITSQNVASSRRSTQNVRQLARQAHSLRTPSPPRPDTARHKKPPFVVRHVSEDIFKLPQSCRRRQIRASSRCRSCDLENEELEFRHLRYLPDSESDDNDEHFTPKSAHSKTCSADRACRSHHCGRACTVCKLYRSYFGHDYPRHQSSKVHVKFETSNKCNCKHKIEIPSEAINFCKCQENPSCCEGCNCNVQYNNYEPDDKGHCQCSDEEEGCQCESDTQMLRCMSSCQCQDEEINCSCEAHSLSGWCRRKRKENQCELLMDRIKDFY